MCAVSTIHDVVSGAHVNDISALAHLLAYQVQVTAPEQFGVKLPVGESRVDPPTDRRFSSAATEKAITIGVLVVLILSALVLCTRNLGPDLANADGLWMDDYLRDWLVRGVDMTTWQSPMAPNYFPEMFMYGLIRYAAGSIYLGFIGFRLAKFILFIALFYLLLASLVRLSRTYRFWIASLLSCAMVLATACLGVTQDFWQLYVPTAHGGAFVNAQAAVLVTLYCLENPDQARWQSLAVLGLLCTMAVLSDMIFVAWFTVPAIAALGILALLGRISKRSLVGYVVCLFAAFPVERIAHGLTPYNVSVPRSLALFEGWKATSDLYFKALVDGWYQRVVVVVFICAAGIAARALFSALKNHDHGFRNQVYGVTKSSHLFLLCYAVLVTPATFLAMATINRPAPQYLMGGNLAPLALLVFAGIVADRGQRVLASRSFYASIIVLMIGAFAGVLAFSGPSWAVLVEKLNPRHEIYPELVACLDSHASDFDNGAGVADYWEVRPINLLSKKGLRVDNVVAGEFSPLPVQAASNREMFEEKKRTWVITNTTSAAPNIRESDMIRWQGQPDVRFVCTNFPILVYKNGVKIVRDNNPAMNRPGLDAALASFTEGKVDRLVVRWPENRPTLVGEWKNDDLQSTGRAGYLQVGPYISLPAGSYHVEWHGRVDHASAADVGRVDVSVDAGSRILANAPVTVSSLNAVPNDVLAGLDFSVGHAVAAAEFRFYVNEKALVSLNDVVISRSGGYASSETPKSK